MANQIGKFFEVQRDDEVVPGIAYVDSGGDGLDAPVRKAILLLKEQAAAPGYSTETSFQGT